MKATCSILIVALLVASAYTQSCDATTNKFLGAVKNINANAVSGQVTLPTATAFEVCNDIWKVSGTCCVVGDMKSVFKTKMEDIRGGWNKFIKALPKVKEGVEKLKKMGENRDNVKASLAAAKSADANQLEGLEPEQGAQLVDKVKDFDAMIDEFKKDSKACFDYDAQVKGTGFCYGCSANPTDQAYFSNTDGKLTVNQATSTALAEKCIKVWGFMHGVGGMMQMFAVINKQRKPDADAPKRPPGDKPAHGGVPEPEVFAAFKECKDATVTVNCTQDMINKLVAANFNLFAPPKRANDDNMGPNVASSQPTRLLQTSFSGDTGVSSNGADLTKSVGAPSIDSSIDIAPLSTSSSGKILLMAAISALAAFFLTIN
jgi:hypothetical protein